MKINCVIAGNGLDDNNRIVTMLGQFDFLRFGAIMESSLELIDYLYNNTPDLIFMDADFAGLENPGLAAALPLRPLIILTSEKGAFSLPGAQLFIIGYLHKPFAFERVRHLMVRINGFLPGN